MDHTDDASGKVVKVTRMKARAGPIRRRAGDMARCCREARAVQKISGQPAGSAITGCIFHRSGLGGVVQNKWGVQNVAIDGDRF